MSNRYKFSIKNKLAMILFATAAIPVPALAGTLLGSLVTGQTIFSDTYTTTGANSSVFGNILAGDVSTTGANAGVFGNIVSVGAANTGGAGSTVSGSIATGDVLTTGDGSLIGGDILASGASTIGANSHVAGNLTSVGAATTGDNSRVGGSVQSGGAATVGANSIVTGAVAAVGAITISASGTVGSSRTLTAQPFVATDFTNSLTDLASDAAASVVNAKAALNKMGGGTLLAATMTTDTTLYSGVYSAASFSTTAGTTLTLDGKGLANQFWVFNIADILATGASTVIVLKDVGANSSVIWNTGGYASLGASSTFIGTILAQTYISVGAGTMALGIGGICGGLYSATSYVSTGDGAKVGGNGCTAATTSFSVDGSGAAVYDITPAQPISSAVPESSTWAMMIAGMGLVGWSMRRRSVPVTIAIA